MAEKYVKQSEVIAVWMKYWNSCIVTAQDAEDELWQLETVNLSAEQIAEIIGSKEEQ